MPFSTPLRRALAKRVVGVVLMCAAGTVGRASTARAQGSAAAGGAVRSTRDHVYSSSQAAEGRDIYDGRCKSCHTAISHTGTPFRANWDKRPLSDLWDYILEKMPKDAPGTLETDEYAKVLAYILRMNGMPSGSDDLPANKKALKAIRIDAPAAKAPT